MPLTMRPTGLGHGVYKDIIDYGVFGGEWGIGRIYERRGFPDDVRFYCADSDDPGQGFQLKAATIPIEGGQYCPSARSWGHSAGEASRPDRLAAIFRMLSPFNVSR